MIMINLKAIVGKSHTRGLEHSQQSLIYIISIRHNGLKYSPTPNQADLVSHVIQALLREWKPCLLQSADIRGRNELAKERLSHRPVYHKGDC